MEQSNFIHDGDTTDCEWEMEDSNAEVTSSDNDDIWVPTNRERKPRNTRTSQNPNYQDHALFESESEHSEHQSSDDNWEPVKKVKITRQISIRVTDEIDGQKADDVQYYESKTDGTHVDTINEPELGAALDEPPKKKKVWPKMYNKGPFICAFCEKQFRGLLDLTRHERTHTNEKPWVCEECGRGFSSQVSLKGHQVVHSSERPFSCLQCDMSFAHKSYLKIHIAKHSNEKPFVCKFCGFRVKYSSSLRNHLRTHRTEKNFACEVCGKKFLTRVLQRGHQERHADPKNRVNQVPKEGKRRQRARRTASRAVHVERISQTMSATCIAHNKTNAANKLQTMHNTLMHNSLQVPHRPLGVTTVFPSVGPNSLLPNQTALPLRGPIPVNSPMMNPASRPVMASRLLSEFSQAVARTRTLWPKTPLWHGMSSVNPETRRNNVQTPHPSVLPNSVQPLRPFPTSSNTPPLICHSVSGAVYYGIPVSGLQNSNFCTPMVNPSGVTPYIRQNMPFDQSQSMPSAVVGASNFIAVPVMSNPMSVASGSSPSNTALTAQVTGSPSIAQLVLSSSVLPVVSQSSSSSSPVASSGSTLQERSLPLSTCTVPETSKSTPITLLGNTISTTSPDAIRMTSSMIALPSTGNAVLSDATPTGQLAKTSTPAGAIQTNTNSVPLTSSSTPSMPLLNTKLASSPVTFSSSVNARPLSNSVVPQYANLSTAPLDDNATAPASPLNTNSVQVTVNSNPELPTEETALTVPVTCTQMTSSLSTGDEAWSVTPNKVMSAPKTASSVSPALADKFDVDTVSVTSNSAQVMPPTVTSLKAPTLDDIQLTSPVGIIETSTVPLDNSKVTQSEISAPSLCDNAEEKSFVRNISSSQKKHNLFLSNTILTSHDLTSYSTKISYSTDFWCEKVLQTTTATSASSNTSMHLNNTLTDNAQLTIPSSSGCKLLLTSSTLASPTSTNPLQVTPNSALRTTVIPEAIVSKVVPDVNRHASTVCSSNSSSSMSSQETLESVLEAITSELQSIVNKNPFECASPSAVSVSSNTQGNPDLKPALLASTKMTSPSTIQSNHCPVMPHHNKSPTLPVLSTHSDSVAPASSLTPEVISPPSLSNTSSSKSARSLIAEIVAPFLVTSRPVSRDGPHLTSPMRKTPLVTTYSSQPMTSSYAITSQSAPIKSNVEIPRITQAVGTYRTEKRLPPPSSTNSTVTSNLTPSVVKGSSAAPSTIDTLSEGPLLASSSQPHGISPEVLNGPANNVVVLLSSGKVKSLSSFPSSISLSVPASPAMNPFKVSSTSMVSSSQGDTPSSDSLMSNTFLDTPTVTTGVSSTVVTTFTPTISTAAASTASHTISQTSTSNKPSTVQPAASCTFVSTVQSCVTRAHTTTAMATTPPTVTSTVAPSVVSTVTPPSACLAGLDTSVLETLPNYEDAVYFTYFPLMVIKTPFGPGSDNVVKQSIRS